MQKWALNRVKCEIVAKKKNKSGDIWRPKDLWISPKFALKGREGNRAWDHRPHADTDSSARILELADVALGLKKSGPQKKKKSSAGGLDPVRESRLLDSSLRPNNSPTRIVTIVNQGQLTPVTGPTLVYDHGESSGVFLCSACRKSFQTDDPAEAMHLFQAHRCSPAAKRNSPAP